MKNPTKYNGFKLDIAFCPYCGGRKFYELERETSWSPYEALCANIRCNCHYHKNIMEQGMEDKPQPTLHRYDKDYTESLYERITENEAKMSESISDIKDPNNSYVTLNAVEDLIVQHLKSNKYSIEECEKDPTKFIVHIDIKENFKDSSHLKLTVEYHEEFYKNDPLSCIEIYNIEIDNKLPVPTVLLPISGTDRKTLFMNLATRGTMYFHVARDIHDLLESKKDKDSTNE